MLDMRLLAGRPCSSEYQSTFSVFPFLTWFGGRYAILAFVSLFIWVIVPGGSNSLLRQFDSGQFRVLESNFLYGGEKIYAIIEIGGKQYKVAPKQTIEVERLDVPEGDIVELDRVLFIGGDKDNVVGDPVIKGAKVVATSLGEAKGEKVIAFRYKSKVRHRSKRGHRQTYTKILVNEIIKGEGE